MIDADSVCACVCVCVCVRACVRVHVCAHACVCEAVKRPFTAVSSNPRVAAEAYVVSRYRSKRESPSKRMIECHGGHWTDRRRAPEWQGFRKCDPVKNMSSLISPPVQTKTLI